MKFKSVFITGNYRKKEISNHLSRLVTLLQKKEISVFVNSELNHCLHDNSFNNFKTFEEILEEEIDIIFAFGGDGTILYTAAQVKEHEIPILGFNLGGLGFLADLNVEEITKAIEYISHNEFNIDERSVLKLDIAGKTTYAFNDIVLDKAGYKRVIEINVDINDHYLNSYVADGLIISTPTGSTGYNLSSGGPIVVPGTNVTILSPICPHSLSARPLVVSSDHILKVKVNTEADHFVCNVDGQIVGEYSSGQEMTITKASFQLKLIKIEGHDIFSILRNKLRWGIDFRDKDRWSFK